MPKIKASEAFVAAYIECALWSSTDNADDYGGEPLDKNYDAADLTQKARKQMQDDCNAFVAYCTELGERWEYGDPRYSDDERAGHDFWLTRNGHGAGFWDRGLANGDALSKAAKSFGSCDLYVSRKRVHVA